MQTKKRRPLTARQKTILLRVHYNRGSDWIAPDVARQLIRRGLATKVDSYRSRDDDVKPVIGAIVWHVRLTKEGRDKAGELS